GVRAFAGVAVLLVLGAATPAALAAEAIPPSGTLQAHRADRTQPTLAPRLERSHRPVVPSPSLLRAGKAAAAREAGPSARAPSGGPAPNAVVVESRNQPGLAATDNSAANQGSPPDSTGAIGPTHYVEFVNSKVGVYSRDNLGFVA